MLIIVAISTFVCISLGTRGYLLAAVPAAECCY